MDGSDSFTEDRWLTWTEPNALSVYLASAGSTRKRRLLLCAYCELLSEQLDQPLRSALAAAEQLADGRASAREVKLTREWINALCSRYWGKVPAWVPADYLSRSVEVSLVPLAGIHEGGEGAALRPDSGRDGQSLPAGAGAAILAVLERRAHPEAGAGDLRGACLRPAAHPGDALEEAGCTDETMLDHCRGPGLMFAAAGCSIASRQE